MPTEPFTLIAHRGFSSDAPENTFDAFDLALEHGFNHIETDVQLTADGVPVIIHDDTLDRTTTGAGPVSEAGTAYIKSLEAGLWFEGPADGVGQKGPAAYGDAFVPTLDEVLERYRGRIHLHLELKSRDQELAGVVAESLKAQGWDELAGKSKDPGDAEEDWGLIISSFFPEQLHRSKQLLPEFDHGWLLESITKSDIDLAVKLGLSGIYPRAGRVTAKQVADATDAGLTVRTWGVASEADLRRAFEAGAVGTTVDWPLRAREVLEKEGRQG